MHHCKLRPLLASCDQEGLGPVYENHGPITSRNPGVQSLACRKPVAPLSLPLGLQLLNGSLFFACCSKEARSGDIFSETLLVLWVSWCHCILPPFPCLQGRPWLIPSLPVDKDCWMDVGGLPPFCLPVGLPPQRPW